MASSRGVVRNPEHEVHHHGKQQYNGQEGRAEPIIEARLAPDPDRLGSANGTLPGAYTHRSHGDAAVNRKAEMKAEVWSPKLSMPMASAPRITVKFSHERNVRSFAKKTLGSTRVEAQSACLVANKSVSSTTILHGTSNEMRPYRGSLQQWLARHFRCSAGFF